MRWGILGIGRVTSRMVSAFRAVSGHQVVAVAGRDPAKLAAWAQQHQVENCTASFSDLIENKNLDAIYVALPPSLHAQWSMQALSAGKVVLCEKPLSFNSTEAVELQTHSRQLGVPLYHATAFPHHPRSVAMREFVRSGQLGKLARMTIACSFSHVLHRGPDYRTDPQLGGGCLLDLGWYCAYTTLWMTGLKVLHIQATGKRLSEPDGIWISAQAIIKLEQGVTAIWDCGFDAAGRKWMEIAGSDASLVCDDFLRPWDLEKPRFWVHGHDGKARAEIIGAGVNQEANMIESMSKDASPESIASLAMAVETQSILQEWENACGLSPSVPQK